ncbi:hypothetical protein ARMSODRAFT_958424 [Armillaria solidipes]|uniref:Pheromone n=1 Tax=Armillaria solidipes TaxID=1076256 RepID=A0A2H3BBR9_9AGAR|nr:hypothetical protein ARMSODRAFT_958424 [Armillaria solidipes]
MDSFDTELELELALALSSSSSSSPEMGDLADVPVNFEYRDGSVAYTGCVVS